MFDFGLGSIEILLIAIVAIIVVGPKDLPRLLKTVGNMLGKVRSLAREFQGHLEEAARETGLDDIKNEVQKAADEATSGISGDDKLKSAFEDMGREIEATVKSEPAATPKAKAKKTASAAKKTVKKTAKKPAAAKSAAKKAKSTAAASGAKAS